MREKIICVLMLTLILTSALSVAFVIKPSFAEGGENSISSEDFTEKKDEATLSDEVTKPYAEQEKTSQSSSQTSGNSEDEWNFNDTSEWAKFAYLDGNETRLIVGIDGGNPAYLPELERIAAKYHAEIVGNVFIGGQVRAEVVELLLGSVAAFVADVNVERLANYVEPNMKVQAQLVPNDPYWDLQWGPQRIEADYAWNTTVGDSSFLVAVVDTGIDYTHPDLVANYAPLGYDWVNTDLDPLDDFGHGTHCAGIIATVLNNSVGIAGLAQVRVMAEKVLDSLGGGYDDWVANGIVHAADQGAKIISMSFGGYGESNLIHDAVQYAYGKGVLLVAAAGNDNTNVKSYPAAYDEVIAVAATDQYDSKAGLSNWGDWIELAAPGVNIYSTMPTYHVTLNDYGYAMNYDYLSGTSMACPHVSGAAALLWSQYPNKTRDWLRLWLRYTAEDLGEPGFDEYYGHGRINVRKALEQSPPAHELIAYEWETPPYVRPGTSGIINATVLNFGENNETQVNVQLLANNTVITSTLIGFIASGNSATVSLTWNPTAEGSYNVTLYVVPALGEISLENNVLWKYIYVGFLVKAVVLHSAGNVDSATITNWQVLNSEWRLFGGTAVHVDYATLNKDDITYSDIASTGADVLIVSCAFDPYAGWQFTDSEVEAITQYVHEGHGLIVTAGTLYNRVPNNNKLAPLFGLNETTMWGTTGTDLLHLMNTTHPIFANVPDPLVFPRVTTVLPYDGRWDINELVGGEYLALGHYQESAIVTFRGLVYISPWLEVIPPYYHFHLQLLYNAITWSKYQKPEHELVVSLDCPPYLKPGESALLNATVANTGLNNETGVELYLSIDDTVVNATTIAELLTDSSCTINYLWTPTVEATYNVTAYAPPVPSEEITVNNQESKFVRVFEVVIAVVLDSWGTDYGYNALWDYLNTNWATYGIMPIIIDYTSLNKEDITLADIEATQADVLIISDAWEYGYGWEFADSEIEAIETYVRSGHGIIATSGTFNTMDGMAPNNRKLADLFGMNPDIEYRWGTYTSGTFDLLTPRHDELWRNIPDPYLSDSILTIYPYPSSDWTIQGVTTGWIEALSTDHYATVITSDAITHKAVYFTGMLEYIGQYNENNRQLFYNAIVWTQLPQYEHELAVSLEAPKFLEPGDSSLLNATVYNHGLSNETNVTLELIINGTIVDSELIPELLTGASHTIDYLWTPVEGTYNITAYAPPVSAEEFAANNVATKIVSVRPIKYVLFDQTHGADSIYSYSTWVTSLTNRGYVVETHTIDPITPIVLEGYDVFVIPQAHSSYIADELSAIQNFVFNGGGLLVIGDDNPWIYTELTSFAGITWASGGTSGTTTDIALHPVTTGVLSVYLSAPIAIMYVGGVAQDLVRDPAHDIMLAVSEQPCGKVMGFVDEDSLSNYAMGLADNLRLANNMIDWLAIPIRYEHDLAVSLVVPASLELGETTILNATVRNTGLNNENDVELYLLVNDTVVSSAAIAELRVGESYTLNCAWTPTGVGSYNITAYAPPVPGEECVANNVIAREVNVFFYARLYLPHDWIGGGDPMGWHGDDSSWQYDLPFDFPFYNVYYKTIYISSNGLITFLAPDSSCGNSIPDLAQKLAIAPAWDDWVTYDQYEIYLWQDSTHVGIRWYVRTYGSSTIANFEAILNIDGVMQFNYEYNDGHISATVGISNGAGHTLAEDATSLNYYGSILFLPFQAGYDVAITNVVPSAHQALAGESVNITVVTENQGTVAESFTVSLYASPLNSSKIYFDPSDYFLDAASAAVGYRFNVTLRVHNIEDLAGWQVRMYYNDSIINVTRWFEPTWDPEYVFYGRSTMAAPTPPDYVYDHWGPGTGSAMVCSMLFPWPPEQPSFYGDGKLCIFEFEVLAVPSVGQNYSCSLNVDAPDTGYANPEFEFLGFDVYENGYYWVGYGQPPPSAGYLIGTEHIVDLAPGANVSLTFTWNTTNVPPHDYVIWAEAATIPGEIDTADNIFHDGTIEIIKAPVAAFTYSPVPAIENTPVTFNASASTPNGGYITDFTWDFGDGNITATADPVMTHVYALYGTYNVTLTVQDSEGLTGSTWQLVEVGRHDVAVTEVVSYRAWVYRGNSVNINVTVLNKGDFAENVTVTLYYNITANKIIGTQYNMTLFPGQNQTLFFVLDTTGVEYCHNYTITAVATIPLDNNPADNTLDNVYIKVRIIGDLNGDGKVDITDLAMASAAFGSYPGHPRWNPAADINRDNRIDIQDIARVSANFGKTSP